MVLSKLTTSSLQAKLAKSTNPAEKKEIERLLEKRKIKSANPAKTGKSSQEEKAPAKKEKPEAGTGTGKNADTQEAEKTQAKTTPKAKVKVKAKESKPGTVVSTASTAKSTKPAKTAKTAKTVKAEFNDETAKPKDKSLDKLQDKWLGRKVEFMTRVGNVKIKGEVNRVSVGKDDGKTYLGVIQNSKIFWKQDRAVSVI